MGIETAENFALISPVLYLYSKVAERHQFLDKTIGANYLETKSFESIWFLVQYSICSVVLVAPIQICSFQAYHRLGHPWKVFIGKVPKDNISESKKDYSEATVEASPSELLMLKEDNSFIV